MKQCFFGMINDEKPTLAPRFVRVSPGGLTPLVHGQLFRYAFHPLCPVDGHLGKRTLPSWNAQKETSKRFRHVQKRGHQQSFIVLTKNKLFVGFILFWKGKFPIISYQYSLFMTSGTTRYIVRVGAFPNGFHMASATLSPFAEGDLVTAKAEASIPQSAICGWNS